MSPYARLRNAYALNARATLLALTAHNYVRYVRYVRYVAKGRTASCDERGFTKKQDPPLDPSAVKADAEQLYGTKMSQINHFFRVTEGEGVINHFIIKCKSAR